MNKDNILSVSILTGWAILLAGLFFFPSRDFFKSSVYLFCTIPSLFFLYQFIRTEKNKFNSLILLFFCVLGWLVFSSLWSVEGDFDNGLKRALNIGVLPIFFYYLLQKKDLFEKVTLGAVTLVSVLLAFWMIKTGVQGVELTKFFRWFFLSHIDAMFNILMFGHVLGFLTALMLALALSSTGYHRFFAWGNFIVLLTAVWFLQQRTPIGSILLCCLAALVCNVKLFKRWYAVIFVVFLAILGWFNYDLLMMLVDKVFVRKEIWQEVIRMSLESPIWGHGWDTELVIAVEAHGKAWYDAHNLFLQMFFYGGGVGVLLLMVLYAGCFVFAVKQKSPFAVVLIVFGFFAIQTDGMGLLCKPKEEWFNIWIPLSLLIAESLVVFNAADSEQAEA